MRKGDNVRDGPWRRASGGERARNKRLAAADASTSYSFSLSYKTRVSNFRVYLRFVKVDQACTTRPYKRENNKSGSIKLVSGPRGWSGLLCGTCRPQESVLQVIRTSSTPRGKLRRPPGLMPGQLPQVACWISRRPDEHAVDSARGGPTMSCSQPMTVHREHTSATLLHNWAPPAEQAKVQHQPQLASQQARGASMSASR